MPSPQQNATAARRQAQQQQISSVINGLQKTSEAELARTNAQRAVLEATLINLRSKLADLEADNWMFEAPRHTFH
ncbi:hypothetical protein D9Q98_005161 [Chlorella vulgaris]|uniref:Uncharacterized protein n=1 Tax=Chlorella vulgaris TaxID=3077 RepID=A0A9D4TNL0_CHLVU|nr:hypothetical protein D9Q98_005161 [Chlorella vulgaris]